MAGLSNADFAQIFATTRKEDAGGGAGGDSSGKRKDGGSKGGGGAAKKFKPHSKKAQTAAEAEAQQFRDRAKERRLGTSKEYTISEEAVKSLTVEESKYLGGDMEHTHLVKGLDFALLAKVRAEMDIKEDARDEQLEKQLDEALVKLEATTLLGKTVRNTVLTERRSGRKNVDMFLPGRTTFVFDLDDDFATEIPTAVSRCDFALQLDGSCSVVPMFARARRVEENGLPSSYVSVLPYFMCEDPRSV
jgi:hypothetical protein